MINVAYCIHDLDIGGAQSHLIQVLKLIDRSRFNPLVLCLSDIVHTTYDEELKQHNIPVILLTMQKGKLWSPFNLKKLFYLISLLKEKDIHVVHSYLFEANLLGTLAGRAAHVPVLISSKRSIDSYQKGKLIAVRLSNILSSRVTVNSQLVKEHTNNYEGFIKKKAVLIPNGVKFNHSPFAPQKRRELRSQWGIPEDAFVVGTIARFYWKKGYEYFLEMASLILKKHGHVYFTAIGDGSLRPEMEKQAQELGINKNVIFTGALPGAEKYLPVFDLYVCTSVIEGMSNALLEAMAKGLPVVATAVGGNGENVIDGHTGFLVPPRNPQALADKIIELLSNPQLIQTMSTAGKKRIETEYSLEKMIEQMENLYINLLEKY